MWFFSFLSSSVSTRRALIVSARPLTSTATAFLFPRDHRLCGGLPVRRHRRRLAKIITPTNNVIIININIVVATNNNNNTRRRKKREFPSGSRDDTLETVYDEIRREQCGPIFFPTGWISLDFQSRQTIFTRIWYKYMYLLYACT